MTQILFKLDKERDARNFWELGNSNSNYEEGKDKKTLENSYKDFLKGKKFEECKQEIIDNLNEIYSSGIPEIFLDSLNKSWEKISDIYFNRLEEITKKPIFSNQIISYITTIGRCTHDPKDNSIIISLKRPLLQCLRTIGHEIMHLQFYNYYWMDTEKKIGHEKTQNLSESLTVLLNREFKDLWFVLDEGYPCHKKNRDYILNEWEKNKDFEILLNNYIKNLNNFT